MMKGILCRVVWWTLLLSLILAASALAQEGAPAGTLKVCEEKNRHILAAGKAMQLQAVASPAPGAGESVMWRVTDPQGEEMDSKLVKISGKGLLSSSAAIQKATNVVVTASLPDGREGSYSVLVYPKVKALSIRPGNMTLYAQGKERRVWAVTSPSGLGRTIRWKVDAPSIATLKRNPDGSVQIIPRKKGIATLTAQSRTGVTARVKLRVLQPVTKISISGPDMVRQNEAIFLRAVVFPRGADHRAVEWSLDVDKRVAEIGENGRFKPTLNAPVGKTITVYCRAKGTDREVVATKEVLILYAWQNID